MFIKRKKNRSGTVSIVVAEKISGYYKELTTIGIARPQEEVDSLIMKGRKWIDEEQERRHPRLDLFGEERKKCEVELLSAEQMLPDFITFFNFSYKPALQVSVAAFFSLIWVTHGNFVSSCYVCA